MKAMGYSSKVVTDATLDSTTGNITVSKIENGTSGSSTLDLASIYAKKTDLNNCAHFEEKKVYELTNDDIGGIFTVKNIITSFKKSPIYSMHNNDNYPSIVINDLIIKVSRTAINNYGFKIDIFLPFIFSASDAEINYEVYRYNKSGAALFSSTTPIYPSSGPAGTITSTKTIITYPYSTKLRITLSFPSALYENDSSWEIDTTSPHPRTKLVKLSGIITLNKTLNYVLTFDSFFAGGDGENSDGRYIIVDPHCFYTNEWYESPTNYFSRNYGFSMRDNVQYTNINGQSGSSIAINNSTEPGTFFTCYDNVKVVK